MKLVVKIILALILFLIVADLAIIVTFKIRQKTITQTIQNAVKEYVNGEVEIGEVKGSLWAAFPNPAVEISGIQIKDRLYKLHKQPFFQANQLILSVRLKDLISNNLRVKSILIKNGEFNVFTDSSGQSNDYLFKGKPLPQTHNEFIDHLTLKDVAFKNRNEQKQNAFEVNIKQMKSRFDKKKDALYLDSKCDIFTKTVMFHDKPSSFFSDKHVQATFSMIYNRQKEILKADSVDLQLDNNKLNIGITIDLSEDAPVVNSKINSGKLILF